MSDLHVTGDLVVDGTITANSGMNVTSLIANSIQSDEGSVDATWVPFEADSGGVDLQNGWKDLEGGYPVSRFRRDYQGVVHLQLFVWDGSSSTIATFTSPSFDAYRPGHDLVFMAYGKNRIAVPVRVGSNGVIQIMGDSFDNGEIILCTMYQSGNSQPTMGPGAGRYGGVASFKQDASADSATITHNLGLTAGYTPIIMPIADPGGSLGEIYCDSFTDNSFKVWNTGSFTGQFRWSVI